MCCRYYFDEVTAKEIDDLVRGISDEMKHGTGVGYNAGAKLNAGMIQKSGAAGRDIHPSDLAPVVLADSGRSLTIRNMNWGFQQKQNNSLIINARAESVTEKKMFRESVLGRRCVIPARHYYEWDADKNKATFSRKDNRTLFMAGFYNLMDAQERFVIITTEANASVRRVHDRMPLILEREQVERWVCDPEQWQQVLQSVPAELRKYQEYEQQRLMW